MPQSHTDFPSLNSLEELLRKQQQQVARRADADEECRQLNGQIDLLLASAGVDAVECAVTFKSGNRKTFEVRRAVSRNGTRYATVTAMSSDG